MEDIQLITYIVFAVLYLIFKVMQKKKNPQQEGQDEVQQQPQRPRKPAMTFEEMLREFSGEPPPVTVEEPPIRPQKRPKKDLEPEKKYFSYDNEYEDQTRKTYQESIERGKQALTLNEQVDIDKLKVNKIQVVDEAPEGNDISTNAYLSAFKDIDGAKKAFIYSEIYKRKYV